jgi:putative phosphoribosyl transferase
MRFTSRTDAGCQLGQFLRKKGIAADLVFGLPRGGVVVAAEVAWELKRPLDVLVVRKIGHPLHREFAIGALAEPDVIILDELMLSQVPLDRADLNNVIAEEISRLDNYFVRFHFSGSATFGGKAILIVDDGLATGATAEAAVISAKQQGARHVIVAAPVASTGAVEKLQRLAEVKVLLVDDDFIAVGQYYKKFDQTTDEEVIALLRDATARHQ